jgi:hypothetical protein
MKRSPGHPPKWVEERAEIVTEALASGASVRAVGGKRLTNYSQDRTLISIPLGLRWRLVCREDEEGRIAPVAVLSHERYNRLRRGKMIV